LTSASLSDFEDLRAGQNGLSEYGDFAERPDFVSSFEGRDTVLQNDERSHIQVGTGYSQYDFLQKIRFALNDSTYFKANVNYSTSSNVPRYDRLIERQGGQLKFAEWDYGPQNRLLASLNTQLYRNKSLYSKANILLAYQRIDEDRIRRKFGSTIRSTQEEDVHVISLNADFNKFYTEKKHSVLNYGLELKHDIVNSNAFDIDLSVDEENRIRNEDVLTRYPDGGSTLSTGSLYANSDWNLGKNQRILVGARYTQVFIRSNFTNELFELPFDEVDLSIGALTGSVGYVGEFNNGWNIRSSVSSAFRAPNVDDFGKVRAKSGNVTVPNDELSSEQAVSFDFGISKTFFKQFRVTGNAFYTSLYDAIVRDTFSLPNGDTTLFIDGAFNRITTNVNTGVANIWGGNIDVEIKVYKEWSAKGSVTYTRGRNVSDDQPLAHIPPTYGGFDLTYKKGAIRTTLAIQFNDTKAIEDFDPSPDSPDNLELATEDGTPAWWVLNWYGTVKVAPKVEDIDRSLQELVGQEEMFRWHCILPFKR